MKYAFLLVILSFFSSCNQLNTKKTSSEEILQEELSAFSWNEVDSYPSFEACDSLSTKTDKKQCFERVISESMMSCLGQQALVVSKDIQDVIEIEFLVSESGQATIINIQVEKSTLEELPDIKQILHDCTNALPRIFPAIKRGQQVKTQFKMPIEIVMN